MLEKVDSITSTWDSVGFGGFVIDALGPDQAHSIEYFGDVGGSFRLASLSKMFSTYAWLVALEEGLASSSTHFEGLDFTIGDLLSHRSGLRFDSGGVVSDEIVDSVLSQGRASIAFERPLASRRIYSNIGFELLARILANLSGFGFQDYVHEAVLAPLSLSNTSISSSVFPSAGRSGAAAGFVSSVVDLSLFAYEVMNPTLVSLKSRDFASSASQPGLGGILPGYGYFDDNSWGYGFEVKGEKSPHWSGSLTSTSTYGHFGASGTFLWCDPSLSLCVGLLTDRPFDSFAKVQWPALSKAIIQSLR